jgi:hypothetical protein
VIEWTLHHGDCLDVLPTLDPVDAVVTDPPYGLEFMGKAWDHGVPGVPYWAAVRDALKPGGHLLAFGGTRTHHRLMVGIEDAGFEIRDVIMWVYGSGFPKSHDIGKGIDRQRDDQDQVYQVTAWIRSARDAAGIGNDEIDSAFSFHGMAGHWTSHASQPAVPTLEQVPTLLAVLGNPLVPDEIATLLVELNGKKGQPGEAWFRREVIGVSHQTAATGGIYGDYGDGFNITTPSTDAATQWDGWGTALKPAWEPIIVARRPLEGTVAQNVLAHGVGGINIDGCRISMGDEYDPSKIQRQQATGTANIPGAFGAESLVGKEIATYKPGGRWPANLIHDGSDEVTRLMPECDGKIGMTQHGSGTNRVYGDYNTSEQSFIQDGTFDSGSAARFFYCAKASQDDRNEGIATGRNTHPTVKPLALMRYLVRLVTPPGGVVLDPFMGSGSTGKAADLESCGFVGIDRDAEACRIAAQRRRAQRGLF